MPKPIRYKLDLNNLSGVLNPKIKKAKAAGFGLYAKSKEGKENKESEKFHIDQFIVDWQRYFHIVGDAEQKKLGGDFSIQNRAETLKHDGEEFNTKEKIVNHLSKTLGIKAEEVEETLFFYHQSNLAELGATPFSLISENTKEQTSVGGGYAFYLFYADDNRNLTAKCIYKNMILVRQQSTQKSPVIPGELNFFLKKGSALSSTALAVDLDYGVQFSNSLLFKAYTEGMVPSLESVELAKLEEAARDKIDADLEEKKITPEAHAVFSKQIEEIMFYSLYLEEDAARAYQYSNPKKYKTISDSIKLNIQNSFDHIKDTSKFNSYFKAIKKLRDKHSIQKSILSLSQEVTNRITSEESKGDSSDQSELLAQIKSLTDVALEAQNIIDNDLSLHPESKSGVSLNTDFFKKIYKKVSDAFKNKQISDSLINEIKKMTKSHNEKIIKIHEEEKEIVKPEDELNENIHGFPRKHFFNKEVEIFFKAIQSYKNKFLQHPTTEESKQLNSLLNSFTQIFNDYKPPNDQTKSNFINSANRFRSSFMDNFIDKVGLFIFTIFSFIPTFEASRKLLKNKIIEKNKLIDEIITSFSNAIKNDPDWKIPEESKQIDTLDKFHEYIGNAREELYKITDTSQKPNVMHIAISRATPSVVSELIHKLIENNQSKLINQRDNDTGDTPLMCVVKYVGIPFPHRKAMMKALLEFKYIKVNDLSNNKTVLDMLIKDIELDFDQKQELIGMLVGSGNFTGVSLEKAIKSLNEFDKLKKGNCINSKEQAAALIAIISPHLASTSDLSPVRRDSSLTGPKNSTLFSEQARHLKTLTPASTPTPELKEREEPTSTSPHSPKIEQ